MVYFIPFGIVRGYVVGLFLPFWYFVPRKIWQPWGFPRLPPKMLEKSCQIFKPKTLIWVNFGGNIFFRFGMLYQEKSGNPGLEQWVVRSNPARIEGGSYAKRREKYKIL
jgi:hypothetical protein